VQVARVALVVPPFVQASHCWCRFLLSAALQGAQIEAMVNSAALMAANRGADAVCMADFEEARDKVIMGAS